MRTEAASVLVAIVNYRTPELVINCLRSLEPEVRNNPAIKVTVVDNASGDQSAEKIAAAIESTGNWSSWATLSKSELNGGFSYGNNFAIRPGLESSSPPAYYWLLNPDTIVNPGTVQKLVDFMQANPKAGICGGGIDEEDGSPWPIAFRFPCLLSEFERGIRLGPVTRLLSRWVVSRKMGDQPEKMDWLCGANMMIRQEVLQDIGLMDEEYFLYFEETDYCLQAQRAGWECWYLPHARVVHIAGQSTGVTGKANSKKRLPGYWFDSRRRYYIKNHGRLYAMATDITWMTAHLLGGVRRVLQGKTEVDPPYYFLDFFKHSSLCKGNILGGAKHKKTRG